MATLTGLIPVTVGTFEASISWGGGGVGGGYHGGGGGGGGWERRAQDHIYIKKSQALERLTGGHCAFNDLSKAELRPKSVFLTAWEPIY